VDYIQKCVWRPDSARTRWRSYSAPPDLLVVIRGTEGGKGKERIGNREGVKEMEGKDVKGYGDGKGREGSTWIFVHGPPSS